MAKPISELRSASSSPIILWCWAEVRGAGSWVEKHKVLTEKRETLGSREQSAFCSSVSDNCD